ncbi:MAG: glycine--tRNA ligase [Phycisphaerales bacterium JB040]
MSDATAENATTSSPADAPKSMDDIMSLCKRRGFVYPASEIYGGINGFWDYGPLGAQLKKNLRDAWWQDVVMTGCCGQLGPNGKPVEIVPLDSCIIQNPKVWEASGHVGGFNDWTTDCKACRSRFRADHLQILSMRLEDDYFVRVSGFGTTDEIQAQNEKKLKKLRTAKPGGMSWVKTDFLAANENEREGTPCPECGEVGTLTAPRQFGLMFESATGAVRGEQVKVYLRPETAQGIFIHFKNVVDTTRVSVPFGIAQTGKSFRNEVTPRNFTFRSREFEQMEIEFFCHADDAKDWYAFWRDWRMQWWEGLGLAGENLQLREHDSDELAHYAKEGAGTSDIEYRFPFTYPGFGELEGVADRTDYDLRQHEQHSGAKLKYFDPTRGELAKNGQPKGEHYLPHVIEPSGGLDRGVLAILCEAYTEDPDRASGVYMKFHPRVAPIKAAVFPLVRKDGMPEKAAELTKTLRKRFGHLGFIETDEKQSIGKRYARMDEAGCPYCFTIDGETMSDDTVTVRERDTQAQERIAIAQVPEFLSEKLGL